MLPNRTLSVKLQAEDAPATPEVRFKLRNSVRSYADFLEGR